MTASFLNPIIGLIGLTTLLLYCLHRSLWQRLQIVQAVLLTLIATFSCQCALGQKSTVSEKTSFEKLAAEASAANEQNRLDEAAGLYKKALALKPSWAEGWWSLGTIYYDRDSYVEAARAFGKLAMLQPKSGSARVMLGLSEFELGHDDEALKDIQEGKKLGVLNDPQLRHVMLYHEGILLLRESHFEAAQESLTALVKDDVQNEDAILALGMSVLQMRPADLPAGDAAAREIVLRAGKAELLATQKKFDEAKAAYSQLANDVPDYPNVHYAYGRYLAGTGDADDAVAEFQSELKRKPDHIAALLQIAALRYRVDSADGVKYAEQAIQLNPKIPLGHYLLGLLYADTGNFTGAIPELESARRSYPERPDIYFALGNAYARTGRKEDAARARAEFKRLNAEQQKQSTTEVYGQRPAGLANEKLSPENSVKP